MPKNRWGAFPSLSEVVEKSDPSFVAAYRERLEVVHYHLSSLDLAARQCSVHVGRESWDMQGDEREQYINVMFDPYSIVRVGDLAIREAASVIDTSLLLMNHVLRLGLPNELIWRSRRKETRTVRSILIEKFPAETDLLATLDRVYSSIGYRLLNGYRNWVTHRGAPRVVYAKPSPFPGFSYSAPEEIVQETKPGRQEWLIDRFINERVEKEFTIQCWPFVPPVREIISGQGQDPELIKRGISVSAGIVVQDARFLSGSPMDDAKDFLAKNPILLEAHRATFAGEALAVYSPSDYTHGVRHVELFVTEQLVRGKWDDELARAYERASR